MYFKLKHMKKTILSLSLFLFGMTAFAQNAQYNTAMKGFMSKMGSAKTTEAYQTVANGFERIAAAEPNEWLPKYYAAFSYVMQAMQETDKSKVDAIVDLAEKNVSEAQSLSQSEELICLSALCKSARINVDPMSRGMKYGSASAQLLEEAKKMESYGAEAIIIMDSAGAYFPDDVTERISTLVNGLSIPVGFHGHNNLGMAVINSVSAVNAGATMIDGTIRGFGAGAGNTQLEVLVAVFDRLGFETGIDLYKILDAADIAEKEFNPVAAHISPMSIVSGLSGVFSGFAKPVAQAAKQYNVDGRDIFFGLGKRNAVAGQESLIFEVARELAAANGTKGA